MLTDGACTDQEIWGALLTQPIASDALNRMLKGQSSAPLSFSQNLPDNKVRETTRCSNGAQISSRGGLSGVPAEVFDMMAAGFDPMHASATAAARATEVSVG